MVTLLIAGLWQEANSGLQHETIMHLSPPVNHPDLNTVTFCLSTNCKAHFSTWHWMVAFLWNTRLGTTGLFSSREPSGINSQQQHNVKTQQTSSPSTQEGLLRVVPATFPGKQEHLTVWERSSIRFLLQHRWAAITSHVPPSAERWTDTEIHD